MLVLSSPSGAGKSTMSRRLLESDPAIRMSVSVTTRPKRPGEVDGVHYHFVSPETFQQLIEQEHFLEWARVFGNFYGSPRAPVREAIDNGFDVLFDIDWQGAQQLAQTQFRKEPDADLVSIFLLPPSMAELERRLRARADEPDSVIAGRMAKAKDEISHFAEYDYVLVNDDADACFANIRTIVAAERLRRPRQIGLFRLVRSLLD
ncbi:guanylate kinase [Thermaurantiacus tibetensis]|uniref:guanylate kinase n=1 Tax=Thermaurantiacus tibetensis TaxID=2759035 RepID=UPI0018908658|nr:guanylate kinase [Thermaurantiacus tibetensis]